MNDDERARRDELRRTLNDAARAGREIVVTHRARNGDGYELVSCGAVIATRPNTIVLRGARGYPQTVGFAEIVDVVVRGGSAASSATSEGDG